MVNCVTSCRDTGLLWRALLGITLFSVALPAAALEYSCLQYGPIDIPGTIVRHTYAGPPDYESVTKGDEPRTVWVLQLDERICVEANRRYPRESIQLEIELALTPEQYQQYRQLLGQRVRVTGELDARRRQLSETPRHRRQRY